MSWNDIFWTCWGITTMGTCGWLMYKMKPLFDDIYRDIKERRNK